MSNFHPLEVVGRGSETQLQVGENSNYLTLIILLYFTETNGEINDKIHSPDKFTPQYNQTSRSRLYNRYDSDFHAHTRFQKDELRW